MNFLVENIKSFYYNSIYNEDANLQRLLKIILKLKNI